MANASPTQGSTFEKITIHSNPDGDKPPKTVDLRMGVSIQYFEDLFSPVITAIMNVQNTSALDGRGIYNSLPIRGGEKVVISITTPIEIFREKTPGEFNITLYVDKVTDYKQEKQQENFILHLVSKEGLTNLNKRVFKKYKAKRIDEVIKDFLDLLECEEIDGGIEKTVNSYNFIGNMRKPLTLAPMLAARGIPENAKDASAGFFLWQTRKGMRFRSVETIAENKKVSQEYVFDRGNFPLESPEKSFKKILSYVVDNNNNITGSQRSGEYSTYRIYWNPHTFEFTQPHVSVFRADDKQASLGTEKEPAPPVASPDNIPKLEMAHRIISGIYNVGTLEEIVDPAKVGAAPTTINMDNTKDIAQSISRYNSIFSQSMTLQIPCNVSLCAGDVIRCLFPQVSAEEEVDDAQSGLYIIKEITHFFSGNKSLSAMKVIRDKSGYQRGSQ